MIPTTPTQIAGSASLLGRATIGASLITLLAAIAMAMFNTAEMVGGGVLERTAVPFRMLILFLAAGLLLRIGGGSWREIGLRSPERPLKVILLVIGGYVAIGAAYAIVSGFVLPAVGLSAKTVEVFADLRGNTGLYIYLLLAVAWGSAAFGEELVFRGYLQSRLDLALGSDRASAFLAVLIQAIIFGALHSYQGAGGAILAGTTGLILGLVYLLGGRNLWACILLHGLVDTISLSAIYLGAVTA